MKKWIYLISDRYIDVYALSVALDCLSEEWNVVRTVSISSLLAQHPRVAQIGHPLCDDEVIKLDVSPKNSFDEKVCFIQQMLGCIQSGMNVPANPFPLLVSHSNVYEKIMQENIALLFLQDNSSSFVDLMFVDEVCRQIIAKDICIASVGNWTLPCIRGTLDYRDLLSILEIIHLIDKVPFIITNDDNLIEYCHLLGKPVFDIRFEDGIARSHNMSFMTPGQMANLILKTIRYGQK